MSIISIKVAILTKIIAVNKRTILIIASIFFFVSILSFAIIPYTSQILTRQLAQPPQIAKAKEVLKDRTNKGIETTKSLINEAIESGFDQVYSLLSETEWANHHKDGLAIFLFENDQLKFWSENIDINNIPEQSDRLINVQNTWCISYWIARDNIKGLLLVKVKYSYPIQNQFLKNEFHSSLKFLEGYSVSSSPMSGSFPLSLFSPMPVVYLTYIPKDFDVEYENLLSILSRVGFLALLMALYMLFWLPIVRKRRSISILIMILLLGGLRVATLLFNIFPQGNWQMFSPEVFAYSWLTPSLGDLLINSVLIFAIACYASRVFINLKKSNSVYTRVIAVVLGLLSFTILFVTDNLFSILVLNSTITLEAYRIFNLSIYSLIEYVSISLWFVTAILGLLTTVRLLSIVSRRTLLIIVGISFFVSLALYSIIFSFPSFYGISIAAIIAFIVTWYCESGDNLKSNIFLVIILLISVYSVIIVLTNADQKDKEVRRILAIKLANERDPIAEVMFPQMVRAMNADQEILNYLDNISEREGDLFNHLNDNYLNNYLKKYDFQITVCLTSSNLIIEETGDVVPCYSFFEEMLNEYGLRIPGTSFYHLNNQNGRISYLGMIEYVLPDGEEICIYIELDSKLSRELLGYPELLLDGDISSRSLFTDYSTAKYFNNELIARTGTFSYPLVNQFSIDSIERYTFIDENGFNHLIYNSEGGIHLYITKPKVSLFNVTASFAWVFLFYYVSLMAWLWFGGLPVAMNFNVPSFKNRIKFNMIQVLILSLILVGMVTITYSVKSFERKNFDSLNEKLLSAMVDIEANLVRQDLLHDSYSDYLTHYLVNLSNVFHSDINLYDQGGSLIATSRPEVFEKHLIGSNMNPFAWHELFAKHSSKLIHTEKIGDMEYLSAYAPLFDNNNKKVAYVNLPYFTRQGEFMHEVFSVIVALINIYALLIMFTIFIAVFISNQISRPLELIREKLSTIDLTKHIEPINYQGKDEVGKLVAEYNRMVVELAESAKKLANSQRQSAWREMAKQIAHEIKNPLTPIKLNLQHLVRAKNENKPGWEVLFDKFAVSLIDQINTLSNIATEFSNFAKMPVGQFENVSLNSIIDDSVTLFSAYPNISVERVFNFDRDITIYADKEQIHRVFVNLLKNAVQAIGRKENGKILISLNCEAEKAMVVVEDNGTGIAPDLEHKLFSPNFTTKSGGMGLGLAISKGVVELIGGRIWFETEHLKWTKFYIELPITSIAK